MILSPEAQHASNHSNSAAKLVVIVTALQLLGSIYLERITCVFIVAVGII